MLGALMSGEAPKELDRATSEKVTEMMGRLLDCLESNKGVIAEERMNLELFKLVSQRAVEESGSGGGGGRSDNAAFAALNVLGLPDRMLQS